MLHKNWYRILPVPLQREARRAKQQAALEKQILKELRESAKALKTIKEGYVEQVSTMVDV